MGMLLALRLCLALAWADPLNPAPPEEAADRNDPFNEAFDVPAGDASALRGLADSAGFQSVAGAIDFGVATGAEQASGDARTGTERLRPAGQSNALVVIVVDSDKRLAAPPRGRIGGLVFDLRDDGASPDVALGDDRWSATLREYPAGEPLEILEGDAVRMSAALHLPRDDPYPTVIVTLAGEGAWIEGLEGRSSGEDISLGPWLLGGLGLLGFGWALAGPGDASRRRRRSLRRWARKLR